MTIGVLAFQGDVSEHMKALQALGAEALEVRSPSDLQGVHGLIIPGGESTVISKFLRETSLDEAMRRRCREEGFPVYGTCAGAILVSSTILSDGDTLVSPLGLMDISVERNAYGRQAESFVSEMSCVLDGKSVQIRGAFIRAPIIRETGKSVEVLAQIDDSPVLCRQGNILVSTFHPELLEGESHLHRYFITLVQAICSAA